MKGMLTVVLALFCYVYPTSAQNKPVSPGQDGRLLYATDSLGNRIPDFSYCGYMAGEKPIPHVPVRIVVPVKKGDATQRIQSAIDYVASLPLGKDGIRGAVLLEKGVYEVTGSLLICASGVVLRGSGMGEDGTVLVGMGRTRETLIRIAGINDRTTGTIYTIADKYVPVNAMKIEVNQQHTIKVDDHVMIHRPSTKEWIAKLGMREFGGETEWLGWKEGRRDIFWDRKVTAVNGNQVTLDAPLTTALDANYGGGNVIPYQWPGRIAHTGVENLRCQSTFDKENSLDEDHRWMAITMENVRDAWVRQVVVEHFAGSAVALWETASRVTVEDCKSLAPVSEIGGQRRYTFYTAGQQTLFQRIYSEYGYHDFAAGFSAAGPNAFVQCESYLSNSFSGTIDSWASGILFDIVNIDGNTLSLRNRGQDGQGAGWTAANSVLWQCTAAKIECFAPPMAMNWAYGCWGQFAGNGYWEEANSHVKPRSLYYAQLSERLGGENIQLRSQLLPIETDASSSPTVEQATALSAQSSKPSIQLTEWIDQAPVRIPIPVSAKKAKTVDQIELKKLSSTSVQNKVCIQQGRLTHSNEVITGKRHNVSWWRGDARYYGVREARPHVTRFVPGRIGYGLTDDLQQVVDWMDNEHVAALEHNYGLWYERRRDDHERIRRMDGEVWPPFYELPFARSGKGLAWDGLSKYDLTKYNPWYWGRLKQFANLASQKGKLLLHQNYFQHNILEAGAHWTDFPWRSANNVNNTDFPEPPPYAGDKRIFMAEQFYDVTHPVRRELHRSYIRRCLENFDEGTGVVHLTSAEYTGPLSFVQFWLDVIAEWEKETGKSVMVGLSATKDVQDAILRDPGRSLTVDVIDIRYWHVRSDGSLYAPAGGQNLAPRQHARLVKPGRTSFEQVYKVVREYREKFPDKAVTYFGDGCNEFGWAVFMAGGSLANIPAIGNDKFYADAATMKPVVLPDGSSQQFALSNTSKEYIVYKMAPGLVKLDLSRSNEMFRAYWINPENGNIISEEKNIKGGQVVEIQSPQSQPLVLWVSLHKKKLNTMTESINKIK